MIKSSWLCLVIVKMKGVYSKLYLFFAVDSNDKLYGCDKKFIAEVNKIVATIIETIFEYLKSITSVEVILKYKVKTLVNSYIYLQTKNVLLH